MEFISVLVVEPGPCQGPFHDALASSDQPFKPSYSLAIVISQPKFKDALGSKFLQSLVHILSHGIEVLVSLVAQPKDLEGNADECGEAGAGLFPFHWHPLGSITQQRMLKQDSKTSPSYPSTICGP